MPKQRQIPRLFPQRLADGTTVYHWKPSKTLRAGGFTNQKLGTDMASAVTTALELNRQVEAWQRGAPAGETPAPRQLPRLIRWDELVGRYRASKAFTDLRPSTRKSYDQNLNRLRRWAQDGQLFVRDIDLPLLRDLRNEVVANSSPFVAGNLLRVIRLLLGWGADQGICASFRDFRWNAPEAPARRVQMGRAARDAIVAAADALGLDDVSLAIPLTLWMCQRRADVLGLNRMAWRPLDLTALELDPRHAARLVDTRGRAMAFRLAQQKTGTWIDAPIPPELHARIDARFAASNHGHLFPDVPDQRERAPSLRDDHQMPGWRFWQRFVEAKNSAIAVAIMDGDMALAEAIDSARFQDLRRTGMIFYKDAGAAVPNITAISGHAVLGRKTILDTYMPGDTAGACACVAAGIRFEERRAAQIATG